MWLNNQARCTLCIIPYVYTPAIRFQFLHPRSPSSFVLRAGQRKVLEKFHLSPSKQSIQRCTFQVSIMKLLGQLIIGGLFASISSNVIKSSKNVNFLDSMPDHLIQRASEMVQEPRKSGDPLKFFIRTSFATVTQTQVVTSTSTTFSTCYMTEDGIIPCNKRRNIPVESSPTVFLNDEPVSWVDIIPTRVTRSVSDNEGLGRDDLKEPAQSDEEIEIEYDQTTIGSIVGFVETAIKGLAGELDLTEDVPESKLETVETTEPIITESPGNEGIVEDAKTLVETVIKPAVATVIKPAVESLEPIFDPLPTDVVEATSDKVGIRADIFETEVNPVQSKVDITEPLVDEAELELVEGTTTSNEIVAAENELVTIIETLVEGVEPKVETNEVTRTMDEESNFTKDEPKLVIIEAKRHLSDTMKVVVEAKNEAFEVTTLEPIEIPQDTTQAEAVEPTTSASLEIANVELEAREDGDIALDSSIQNFNWIEREVKGIQSSCFDPANIALRFLTVIETKISLETTTVVEFEAGTQAQTVRFAANANACLPTDVYKIFPSQCV